MSINEDLSTHCVINHSTTGGSLETNAAGPESLQIIESAQRLMAKGIGCGGLNGLGLDEATLRAFCEYARLSDAMQASEAVEATLGLLAEETKRLDMELEMLSMRKRALNSRVKLLRKLAGMLDDGAV